MKGVRKKLPGSTVLADMIPVVIAIIITGMLALLFSMWVFQFEQKEAINSIAREYLLRMETVGCLNSSDCELLKEELKAHDVEDISLEGTTFIPVENGQRVVLKISGIMKVRTLQMETLFQWNQNAFSNIKIEIERTATAIY